MASPRSATTTGGDDCSIDLQCPATNAYSGYLSLLGQTEWTAPDETVADPDEAHPFDGLAYWTESSQPSTVGGSFNVAGIVAAPNAALTLTSQASMAAPAMPLQIIARSLAVTGQVTVTLVADRDDHLTVPT
jgi:hypothetical protein